MATDLTLDKAQFTKDMTAQTGKSTIDQDLSLATALNLPGTPTFFPQWGAYEKYQYSTRSRRFGGSGNYQYEIAGKKENYYV